MATTTAAVKAVCSECNKPFKQRAKRTYSRCWKCRTKNVKVRCGICGKDAGGANNTGIALCPQHKKELAEIKALRHEVDFPERETMGRIRLYRVSEVMPRM